MPVHADSILEKPPIAVFSDPLQPYVPSAAKPWNARRVAHLYRRLGFGATLADIQQGLLLSPSDLVDQLLTAASDLGPPDPPIWSGYTSDDYDGNDDLIGEHRRELYHRWLTDMLHESVRAKLALFWHNHFVTELQAHECNSYLWSYYSLIHEYALGNFRTFTREMGKNAAMLVYLNGNLSVAGEPNENYARELLELFTLGEGNGYTQSDIVEMARALTGWEAPSYACTPAYFNAAQHDTGPKTIFGQTANYNFTTAHNLVFSQRGSQVAQYITAKLYRHYIYQQPDPQVLDGLAATFQNSNWELLPLLRQLFKSEHFFDDTFINARLKNPLESMLPLLRMSGARFPDHVQPDWWDDIAYWSYQLGQDIFNPPNVAGWPGHRQWINESTLTSRWYYSGVVAYFLTQNDTLRENLRSLAQTLTGDSNSPVIITQALIDFFMGQTLDPVHFQAAVAYFKANIPENYFLDGSWNLYWDEAPDQIVNMLYYLVKLPEFQLT